MDDFDFGSFGEDDNQGEESRQEKIQRVHRLMFINDCEKFVEQQIALSPNEFIDMFGKPDNEDKDILTQIFIKDYIRWWDNSKGKLIDKWGLEWIDYLRIYNVGKEEYELCGIFKEVYGEGKDYYAQLGIEQQIKDLLS